MTRLQCCYCIKQLVPTSLLNTLKYTIKYTMFMLVLLVSTDVSTAQTIATFAGDGTAAYGGDNGAATVAQLNSPVGIAIDSAGNLFIADTDNHSIRKVDTRGTITTVAGNGRRGGTGDNGAATRARLAFPTDVAVDRMGNVFIADRDNHRIRKVDTSGTITTVAGTTGGFSGDGELATDAQLRRPVSVAIDSAGNVFIADRDNHRIRKVDTSGIITTVAGTNRSGYNGEGEAITAWLNVPVGVAIDGAGNLLIADAFNHRIRKVDASGTISTIVGTGAAGFAGDGDAATAAQLNFPADMALDSAGNLFIADGNNHRIRKVAANGIISAIAGTGAAGFAGDGDAATVAQLDNPSGMAIDGAGNLLIADRDNHRIRYVAGVAVVPSAGNSVINPNPDMQIRNGDSTAAETIIARTTVNIGTFKRGQRVTVDFLVRNPGAQVLVLGEFSLPSFLSLAGEPLPATLASFASAVLTLQVDTTNPAALAGDISLASNDPDAFENPFVFTVTGTVSNEPANAFNVLPGVDIGEVNAREGDEDVVLLSFKVIVPAESVPVRVDRFSLAANNTGIQRATNFRIYIDGGTRGQLDNRDVFLSRTEATNPLTFTFDPRTFEPELPMWFIVVADF